MMVTHKRAKKICFTYICGMSELVAISILQQLEEWDKRLFIQLNSKLTNPVFDFLLPYFRDSVFWAPLYILYLYLLLLITEQKDGGGACFFYVPSLLQTLWAQRFLKSVLSVFARARIPIF
jgi:hypothetical protein